MKKILTFLLFNLSLLFGQNDNSECPVNLSIFAEYAKVKNYKSAYEPWLHVFNNCPELNDATFKYGELIIKSEIKNAVDEDKVVLKKQLVELYDKWAQYFPKKKSGVSELGKILSKKAQTLVDYNLASNEQANAIFNEAFLKDSDSFNSPKNLYTFFKTTYQLYKEKIKTAEELFDFYEEISEKLLVEKSKISKKLDIILNKIDNGTPLSSRENRNKRVYETNILAFSTYAKNLDAMISIESSCENLIPLYRKNFEQNKLNSVWLNRAASRMDSKECSDDPLFVELVQALHEINPSANSAYYLGLLKDKAGDSKSALSYYEESLTLEVDNYKKASILYKIAVKFKTRGLKTKSRQYARKALKFQPSMGKAYLLIANLYASSANDCGETQFEKRSIYWLAAQQARKAANVDPSTKKTALSMAKSYEGRAPTRTDIFTEGKEGQIIIFSCWIKDKITVPKL